MNFVDEVDARLTQGREQITNEGKKGVDFFKQKLEKVTATANNAANDVVERLTRTGGKKKYLKTKKHTKKRYNKKKNTKRKHSKKKYTKRK